VNQTEKGKIVEEVRQLLGQASIAIVAHYRGLTVADMTLLRREMRQAGCHIRVVKNTLTRRAAKGSDFERLGEFLAGPTCLTISADPVAPAKALLGFAKNNPNLKILGGVLNGTVVNSKEIGDLAKLPSREVLIAKLLGTMMGPVQSFVGVLAAVPASLVRVLDRVRESKEQ